MINKRPHQAREDRSKVVKKSKKGDKSGKEGKREKGQVSVAQREKLHIERGLGEKK